MQVKRTVRQLRRDLSSWVKWAQDSPAAQLPLDSRSRTSSGRKWGRPRTRLVWVCLALLVFSLCWRLLHQRAAVGSPQAALVAHEGYTTRHPRLQLPIWWFAPFLDHSSFGKEAAQLVVSLLQSRHTDAAAVKLGLLQMHCEDEVASSMDSSTHAILTQLHQTDLSHHTHPAVVVCHNMPLFFGRPPIWASCEPCPPKGYQSAYTVARAMSETSRVPVSFAAACNSLDEVWVPAEYSRTALIASGVAAHKVRIVPPVVNTTFFTASKFQPVPDNFWLSLSAQQVLQAAGQPIKPAVSVYKFVSVFKWEMRKGWDVLLTAYLNEFTNTDAVALYIVTKPFTDGHEIMGEVNSWITANIPAQRLTLLPRLYLITTHLTDQQYAQLLAAVNAFVLPTRGEGFGLPIVEAMSMGLPVLATHYSGITDYLDSSVGFPLMYHEVPVPDTITQPWFKGSNWAEPDVHDLQRMMRYVVTHPQDAASRGRAARQRILSRYSPEVMGKRLVAEFQRIERLVQYSNMTDTVAATHSAGNVVITLTSPHTGMGGTALNGMYTSKGSTVATSVSTSPAATVASPGTAATAAGTLAAIIG